MLNQKIRQVIQEFRGILSPDMNALLEQGADEISAMDIISRALKVGQSVPKFELSDQNGEQRSLVNYLERGPLILTFYRGLWCPFCNLQLKAYGDRLDEIKAIGANLVGVTPEKPDALQILKDSNASQDIVNMAMEEVNFDILFDDGGSLSETFGLQFILPESHQKLLKAMNIDVEVLTGSNRYAFPDPATYVIGVDGVIKWAFVPNNYRRRAEVDDILIALKRQG